MNNYITLDGKRYLTIFKAWNPTTTKPGTIRVTMLGEVDATFGGGVLDDWTGSIQAPVTPTDANWGTIGDLRASLKKRQEVVFIDHYGTSYDAVCVGPFKETSFTPMWDAASNHFDISVRIIKVRLHV